MKTNPAQPVRTGENKPKAWDLSSAGRASALQAGGHRFEPYSGSFFALKNKCERRGRGKKRQEKNEQGQRKETRLHGQAVKTPPFHGGNRGSNPLGVTKKFIRRCGSIFAK